jgi:hypothetical protein
MIQEGSTTMLDMTYYPRHQQCRSITIVTKTPTLIIQLQTNIFLNLPEKMEKFRKHSRSKIEREKNQDIT